MTSEGRRYGAGHEIVREWMNSKERQGGQKIRKHKGKSLIAYSKRGLCQRYCFGH